MGDEPSGAVTWDVGQFGVSGTLSLADGGTVKFEVDGLDELITPAAWNAIDFMAANEPLMRHKVAVSMMEHCPDWIDDDITTPEEVARKISPAHVTFMTEGGGQLCYEAEDMLAGHWVCVFFDANYEIDEPELEG